MALSWAGRRQLMIVGGFIAIILVVIGIIVIPKFLVAPTCFDGKQNGTEQGVDCGGGCSKLCPFQTTGVVVKWSRAFSVTDTVANAVAYIENPNIHAAARDVPYQFKLYDADHQFITERDGKAYIAPNGASAIFEGGIKVGNRPPKYVTFTFTQDPLWVTIDPRAETLQVVASDSVASDLDSKPKLSGNVTNTSDRYGVNDITAVAIFYDASDNAIGVSNTFIPSLAPKEQDSVYFTWQRPFESIPVRNEIIPRLNVFDLKFQ
jgi:hypothetical protein